MLATQGFNVSTGTGTMGFCLSSNSTHGSISIGNLTTTTGNTSLQVGLVSQDALGGPFTVIPPSAGSLVADPVQLTTPVGPVTAGTESAGTPSNFCLFCGIAADQPILTIPIKIHLQSPVLGPKLLHRLQKAPDPAQPAEHRLVEREERRCVLQLRLERGARCHPRARRCPLGHRIGPGDDTFAVPGAKGCGTHGSLNTVPDSVVGVPSPSGNNHLVLDDGSSGLAFPENGEGGQDFANNWHVAFGG